MYRGGVVLVALLCLGLMCATPQAQTPPAPEGKRIGWLSIEHPSSPAVTSYRDTLRQALVGFVNLRQLTFEERHAAGRPEQLPAQAAELVRLKVNVIVAVGHEAVRSAVQATTSIPIVALVSDPVEGGLFRALDDPGPNVTGVVFESTELAHRRLQILKDLNPKLSVVAVVSHGASKASVAEVGAITTTAKGLGVEVRPVDGGDLRLLRNSLMPAASTRIDALLVPTEPWLVADARGVAELAAKYRLPAVYPFSEFADEGGLVSYGPNLGAMYRRAGSYVGRLLTGTPPKELPVERPSRAELIVNVRTAKVLGLTVPASLLRAADRVVQ